MNIIANTLLALIMCHNSETYLVSNAENWACKCHLGRIEMVAASPRRRILRLVGRVGKLVNRIYVTELFNRPSATHFGPFCSTSDINEIYLESKSIIDAQVLARKLNKTGYLCAPTQTTLSDNEISILVHKSLDPFIIVNGIHQFINGAEYLDRLRIRNTDETGYSDIRSIDLYDLIELRGTTSYDELVEFLGKYRFSHSVSISDDFNKLVFSKSSI